MLRGTLPLAARALEVVEIDNQAEPQMHAVEQPVAVQAVANKELPAQPACSDPRQPDEPSLLQSYLTKTKLLPDWLLDGETHRLFALVVHGLLCSQQEAAAAVEACFERHELSASRCATVPSAAAAKAAYAAILLTRAHHKPLLDLRAICRPERHGLRTGRSCQGARIRCQNMASSCHPGCKSHRCLSVMHFPAETASASSLTRPQVGLHKHTFTAASSAADASRGPRAGNRQRVLQLQAWNECTKAQSAPQNPVRMPRNRDGRIRGGHSAENSNIESLAFQPARALCSKAVKGRGRAVGRNPQNRLARHSRWHLRCSHRRNSSAGFARSSQQCIGRVTLPAAGAADMAHGGGSACRAIVKALGYCLVVTLTLSPSAAAVHWHLENGR